MEYQPLEYNILDETNSESLISISKTQSVICVYHYVTYMPLNGLFGCHFQCFMGIYCYHIGLKYIVKSTCYLWNAHISMKSYQLKHITFFNSSNNSYHFKLMGCSSLPWPHRYHHKSQNEPVTKATTIHFTPERSSPPVNQENAPRSPRADTLFCNGDARTYTFACLYFYTDAGTA